MKKGKQEEKKQPKGKITAKDKVLSDKELEKASGGCGTGMSKGFY